MKKRRIDHVTTSPVRQGFLGDGHLASAIVDGRNFGNTDPFILLMDDRLDLPGGSPVGGPHPHAGFETVTLVVEGDGQLWQTGSLEVMTAGSGIVHTEEIATRTTMRILQLWLALPPEKRWTEPFFQELRAEHVPTLKTSNGEIRVYSGASNGLVSPLQHQTPFTLVDFRLERGTEVIQTLPVGYNGFVYVLEGSVWVGSNKIEKEQTGWLDRTVTPDESEIVFQTTERSRFVLYAAKPHGAPIVNHGPFIGDTHDDIKRLYSEYRQGKMPHLNDLPESRKIRHRSVAVL